MARCSHRGPSGVGGDRESEGALSCDAGSEMGRAASPGPRRASRSWEGREWSPPCRPRGPAPCTPGAEPSETCFTCGLRGSGARNVTLIPGHQGLGQTIHQDGDLEGGEGRARGRGTDPSPPPPSGSFPWYFPRGPSCQAAAQFPEKVRVLVFRGSPATAKGSKQAAALPTPGSLSSCGP